MSDDRPPVADMPPSASDLIPGMVTVVEQASVPAAEPSAAAEPPAQPTHFDLVLRGYERHQVDGHLDRVAALVEQLRAELAESTRRESSATTELARVRGELERGRPSFDALGERVSQMLGLAESEATQLRADAQHDAKALRHAAGREAADLRSDARREAEELGAAARGEVAELGEQRVALLTEIAAMRDALNSILAAASEQWPSLAPSDDSVPPDSADEQEKLADEDLAQTRAIDLTTKPSTARH
jgi:DivIVA domain-containing protein